MLSASGFFDFAVDRDATIGASRATVFGQVGKQAVHHPKVRAVDEGAAVAPTGDDSAGFKFLQVKRKRCRRNAEGLGNQTGGNAFGSGLDEQAKDIESCFLCEGCQNCNHGLFFHISIIMELSL